MTYPLQPLLSVRSIRETNAQAAVSAAEALVREAEAALAERQAEFERYRKWRPLEVERRYAEIMGQNMGLEDLELFKAGLAALEQGEFDREDAVHLAEAEVEERREELRGAQADLSAARKDKMKIEAHKDIWAAAEAKEAERAADLELEEFTPRALLDISGREDDY